MVFVEHTHRHATLSVDYKLKRVCPCRCFALSFRDCGLLFLAADLNNAVWVHFVKEISIVL